MSGFPRSYYTNQAWHAYYCSCGRIVYSNGGRASHFGMHERRRDGHKRITSTVYYERFPR